MIWTYEKQLVLDVGFIVLREGSVPRKESGSAAHSARLLSPGLSDAPFGGCTGSIIAPLRQNNNISLDIAVIRTLVW